MFWKYFFYNHKSLMYCWKPQIFKQKKRAKKKLTKLNEIFEPYIKIDQEAKPKI